jgi:cobalt/nickel transport protein
LVGGKGVNIVSNTRFLFCLLGITIVQLLLPLAVQGHFGILVPETPAVRRGEPVTLRYSTGHPFECQLVDTQAPEKVQVLLPDGKTRLDIKPQPKQVDDGQAGKVTVQTLTFTPAERGDHRVVVTTPLHFDEHAGGFVQDELQVLVRVQVSRGWDIPVGQMLELVPLTRPYGLKPGFAFKAQARLKGKPLADAQVEIEKLNPTPPREVPEDDALVTQVAKTDLNGYVICTLDDPGWWGMMVTAQDGTKEKDGKQWPIVRRGILWVWVEERSK